jgi:hypothetical protein
MSFECPKYEMKFTFEAGGKIKSAIGTSDRINYTPDLTAGFLDLIIVPMGRYDSPWQDRVTRNRERKSGASR